MPDIHRQQLPDPAAHHGGLPRSPGGSSGGLAEEALVGPGAGGDHPLSLVIGKRGHQHGGGGHQDDLGLQYHHHMHR